MNKQISRISIDALTKLKETHIPETTEQYLLRIGAYRNQGELEDDTTPYVAERKVIVTR